MTHSFPTLRSSYLACAVGLDRGGETAERVRLVHDLAGEDTVRHFCSLAISGTGRASFGFAWNSRSNAAATPMTKRSEWRRRSEAHTSELQSLLRISAAVFCLKKKNQTANQT